LFFELIFLEHIKCHLAHL